MHRWDGDERGHGVGDGRRLAPVVRDLLDALAEPAWVAEAPEAHLLPHLERALAALPLALQGTEVLDDGAYAVQLRWTGAPRDLRALRAAVFTLVGAVAESATSVRQLPRGRVDIDRGAPGDPVVFAVATGTLAGDSPFASHGHVLLLEVAGAFGDTR